MIADFAEPAGATRQLPNVVLVSMPWTNLVQPSLGLAILKAELQRAGVPAQVYHANLDLLEYVSFDTYELVSNLVAINEFLFTGLLEPTPHEAQIASLLKQCHNHAAGNKSTAYASGEELARLFLTLRNHVIPTYLAGCADRILAMRPSLVGFTCMFDQTIASVVLAKLLKEAAPDLPVVLGGYAVQHDNGREVLKAFPWIDGIARGDGEPLIAEVAWASVGAGEFDDIDGLLTRRRLAETLERPAPRWNLKQAVSPNFDDWFTDLQRLEREHKVTLRSPFLMIESSRGCWWGQKHHCTFCGIDDATLEYRSKAPEQVVSEISTLRARYGDGIALRFADYIWPHQFYRRLLPELAEFDPTLRLEAEIKANQNPATIREFAEAGFVGLQPGIESFASSALKKMDKGVTGIQNVQLLKWGYLNGIEIQYNILLGFPDDEVEEYVAMAERIPRLYHFTPPTSCSLVAVTRFAPLQMTPERFRAGARTRHHNFYEVLFSEDFRERTGFDLDNYCYHFDRYFENPQPLRETYGQIAMQAGHWKEQHRSRDVYLGYERTGADYVFEDARYGPAERLALGGLGASIYTLCDEVAVTFAAIEESLGLQNEAGRRELRSQVDQLEAMRLVWVENEKVFGLGTPMSVVSQRIDDGFKWRWNALTR